MTTRDEWVVQQVERWAFGDVASAALEAMLREAMAFADAEWEAKEQETVSQFCRDMQLPAGAAAHYDASVDRPATTNPTPPPREQGDEQV